MSCMNSTIPSQCSSYEEASTNFHELGERFSEFHKQPLNIFLHFVTTPMGMIGAVGLIRAATKSSSPMFAIGAMYLLSLVSVLPVGVYFGTAVLFSLILFSARTLKLNYVGSIVLIIVGYALQDLAHLGTGEKTFQQSYSEGNTQINFSMTWLKSFCEHTYYLLPLCIHVSLGFLVPENANKAKVFLDQQIPSQFQSIESLSWVIVPLAVVVLGSYCLDSMNGWCFFPGAPYFTRVVQCKLNTEKSIADLKLIRDWVMENSPPNTQSSHWWFHSLPESVYKSFDNCAKSPQIMEMFRSLFDEKHFCVDVVDGMNEIYVTGPSRLDESANSDQIFYMRHVDGPWGIIPFVSVYRCLVGMDRNHVITTHFPLSNISKNLCEGDVLGFDFNREVHYIERDDSKKDISDDFRVTLKLHYCTYPRILAPLGWFMHGLNVRYNKLFRSLFLKTINPETPYEHFLAWNVTSNTVFFDLLETYVGQRNLFYLAFAGLLWGISGSYAIFLGLTSFIHYLRYISTYYTRKGIDFGSFKRDVLLFKTISIGQLIFLYLFPQGTFVWDPISCLMVISGYSVSVLATNALGIDRTYFGAELGLVESKWVDKFPYGYIPHPMIVSQVWALLGFYKATHFQLEWPYLVPIHIFLYLTHLMQEQFNIYKK